MVGMSLSFPSDWLDRNPSLKNRMLAGAWFIIMPAEYYILSGFVRDLTTDLSAAVVLILLYFYVVFFTGFALSLIGAPSERERRFRSLSIALVLTWAASAFALVLSKYAFRILGGNTQGYSDIISNLVCSNRLIQCVTFPAKPLPSRAFALTFIIYLIYSIIGYISVLLIIRIHEICTGPRARPVCNLERNQSAQPNFLIVLIASALITSIFHSVIFSGYA